MRWIIKDKELLRVDESGVLTSLPATEIWDIAGKNGRQLEIGGTCIRLMTTYLTPTLLLTEIEGSPFGQLAIEVRSNSGQLVWLDASHKSDHVVIGNNWFPLFPDTYESILKLISESELPLYRPLDAVQYLTCIRDFRDRDWFHKDFSFDAKNWAAEHDLTDSRTPIEFVASLYDYQRRGSDWLTLMRANGIGVVLGDAMGLGKTIQVIKTICDMLEQNPKARTLIICPSALTENWSREIDRFTRGITYAVHRGPDRSRNYRTYDYSIMITTYDVARVDAPVLSRVKWDLIVLDEAQFIKSPSSKRAKAIKHLNRKACLAVTGTPFENHMTDIWSIYDFCLPGFLGSLSSFKSRYGDDWFSARELGSIVAPTMLRRRLTDVPNDLPDIISIPMPIALESDEAFEYERRKRLYMDEGASLGTIVRLITDLASPPRSRNYISALKYEYLETVVDEVQGYGEKIIVFAERNTTISALEWRYSESLPVFVLNGSTPANERQHLIDTFSGVVGSAMLISNPTVGGTGLNITAANHVFHFSMQWNPAKLDQADARAHRHGQRKKVIVHYPYYASTIEEYMWEKTVNKRMLAKEVTVGNKADSDIDEISKALSLSPTIW